MNAILLGAASIVVFHLGTMLACALFADPIEAGRFTADFPASALNVAMLRGLPADTPLGIFLLQVLLGFALWSLFGVAICRVLALRICRDEYCDLGGALRYSWRVRRTGILFPLAIALPALALGSFNALAGLVFQIPWAGWVLSAVLLPLILLSSIMLVLIGLGGFLSLSMVPAAIAVERRGTYDSIGKSFNYILARPIVVLANGLLVFALVWLLKDLFLGQRVVEQILEFTAVPFWTNETYEAILRGQVESLEGFEWFCASVHSLVLRIYDLLVRGLLLSFIFGGGTSLFLILRRDIDGLDEAEIARESM
ncbi:MAG: hypothetical protein EXS14_01685 [Planctomycetes bacterium]|nr:hypothetical protein [Planctomycetota bacterium]